MLPLEARSRPRIDADRADQDVSRRRMTCADAARPVPSRRRVEGSGVTVVRSETVRVPS